ncbi:MAG: hypothetical protein GY870_21375 [archaeon]|nr:hypothetical protein [archaeon]
MNEINENNKEQEQNLTKLEKNRIDGLLHKRYKWIDQARGLTIIFLFISSFTWIFGGDLAEVIPINPVGPTWLNHGWEYFEGQVSMITIIDIGAQIFMFILGITVPISFRSKLKKKGTSYAWIKVGTRFFAFLWMNILTRFAFDFGTIGLIGMVIFLITTIICIYFGLVKNKDSDKKATFGFIWSVLACISFFMMGMEAGLTIWESFFGEALAHLAWGTLGASLGVFLIEKADKRIIVVAGLLITNFILFQLFDFRDEILPSGSILESMRVPFDVIGHIAIAISATCVWDWINMDPKDGKIGMKERVVKFALLMLVLAFIIDFLQPAAHRGTNTALVCLTVGATSSFCTIFYAFENYYDIDIPILSALGRNALFLYLMQGIYTIPYDALGLNAEWVWSFGITAGKIIGLLLCIIPIAILICIAVLMDKKKIYFKF